ncbi:hypothetical protein [Aurantimonas sp. 22II-16-19i]|uniref:DinB/UmuC family translesion DNA polymerase n=1 Tax=Aurantimonas sp. 22II-16-19i TaxID=1317114 RepID=UPI0009FA485B|nr:hypothetical protein [Aurantimonas sp. 22II-16-19i]
MAQLAGMSLLFIVTNWILFRNRKVLLLQAKSIVVCSRPPARVFRKAASWRHCETTGTRGRTVTLKVKYADFRQITRALSSPQPITSRMCIERAAFRLLCELPADPRGVRLLGVTLSGLTTEVSMRTERVQLALPL